MCETVPIAILLKVTAKEMEQSFSDRAAQLGLTAAQMHVLHFVCLRSGEICQRDVEERFDLTHATVSGILCRLQSKGFIRTEPGLDKRRKTVHATDKARACDGRMHAYIEENNKNMLAGFTEAELERLRADLLRILDNLHGGAAAACADRTPGKESGN